MVWSPQERMIGTKPWAALMSEGWWRDATDWYPSPGDTVCL